MRIYYTAYITTNLINSKEYIGVHQTINPDDGYLGSGTHLRWSINKYGKENFTKEIIEYFDNKHQMFLWEAIMVTQDIVDDPMYYNLKLGGRGGWDAARLAAKGKPMSEETKYKLSIANKGKILSVETRAKISAANKIRPPASAETRAKIRAANLARAPMSIEVRAKIGAANTGKKQSAESNVKRSISLKGTHRSEETKAKISASLKRKASL